METDDKSGRLSSDNGEPGTSLSGLARGFLSALKRLTHAQGLRRTGIEILRGKVGSVSSLVFDRENETSSF